MRGGEGAGGEVYGEYLALPSSKPITLADPRVGNKNASAGPISFILTQFLTKILPNYRLAPLLPAIEALPVWEIRDPLLIVSL